MTISTYLFTTTLNVNGLNTPTKRKRFAECIQKQDPFICCQQKTHLLKVRGWKKILHANGNYRKAGLVILLSDKIDF